MFRSDRNLDRGLSNLRKYGPSAFDSKGIDSPTGAHDRRETWRGQHDLPKFDQNRIGFRELRRRCAYFTNVMGRDGIDFESGKAGGPAASITLLEALLRDVRSTLRCMAARRYRARRSND